MFYCLQPDGRDYSKFIGVEGREPAVGRPQTTPLERRDIPPQLATTLEHIVGQLDVITQVCTLIIMIMVTYLFEACTLFLVNKLSRSNQY